jgi:hypothetical protein
MCPHSGSGCKRTLTLSSANALKRHIVCLALEINVIFIQLTISHIESASSSGRCRCYKSSAEASESEDVKKQGGSSKQGGNKQGASGSG